MKGENRQTQVAINGVPVGTHIGGFGDSALISPNSSSKAITPSPSASPTPNSIPPHQRRISPSSAEFIAPPELLVLDPLHISATDYGSPGVSIKTPEVTDASATVSVRTLVENSLASPQNATVDVQIVDATGASSEPG